jgi:hypothetical protein
MTKPTIHGVAPRFAASNLLESVGDAIARAKRNNGMTFADIGAVFGKSDDVAASYAAGHSDMPLSAFVRGVGGLGDDIGNAALAFIGRKLVPIDGTAPTDDAAKLAPVARAVAMVAECTATSSEGGQSITRRELLDNAKAIRDLQLIAAELGEALDVALGLRVAA